MTTTEQTFATGEVTLNYAETASTGPPLLLLHGGSARWQAFSAILPDLSPPFHIYAPDLRGHGKSGWVPGSYRLQDYVDDTIAFLEKVVTRPALLFGHSLGGIVALMVAAQYPEGLHAVAVGDAPLSSETWREVIRAGRSNLVTWRDLAGGQTRIPELIETLKEMPVTVPGHSTSNWPA